MGKIEELKDYLRCVGNSIYDSDEVEKKFEIIAEILLNWCIIRVNAKRFRILEIEFYLFGGKGNHKDIIAYPRTDMEGGEWFFHPSGVDICFKSHCERKDNHYVIENGHPVHYTPICCHNNLQWHPHQLFRISLFVFYLPFSCFCMQNYKYFLIFTS